MNLGNSDHDDQIRVLIADDHAIVREGIKQIVSEAADMTVVAEAADGIQTLERVELERPDVVVLDVQMPRGGGLETLRALRRAYPRIGVLILSFHAEEVFAVPFLREGADGYLAKDNARGALLDAIRRIRSGRKYVSEGAAQALARRLTSSRASRPHDGLSAQELIVLSLLALGKNAHEIGEQLLLSPRVIQRCCGRILHKTGLPTPAAAVQYAAGGDLRGLALADTGDRL